jgi:hypothetical protein
MKMYLEQWWNDTAKGIKKYSEKTLPNCHFIHQRFHKKWILSNGHYIHHRSDMEWSGMEHGSPR